METLLYRWSTTLQIVSDLMIALFFIVLMRNLRRPELRLWLYAWLANVAALGVTVAYWITKPETRVVARALTAGYSFFKTSFIVLLIVGALGFTRYAVSGQRLRHLIMAALVFALLLGFLSVSVLSLGMVQSLLNASLFLFAAWLLVRTAPAGYAWLAMGFAMRGVFAAIEAAAYIVRFFDIPWTDSDLINSYLASHSSFDAAAEWMISLGCVLMMYRAIHDELKDAKARLQLLVEHDDLTGLMNRRSLIPIMRSAAENGATVLFFDLNDFKGINDTLGHQTGDACLKRFGAVLTANFRPEDHVIRYAGDEFIVVAPGMKPEDVSERIAQSRAQLNMAGDKTPPMRFSVGLSYLDVNGEPEKAIRDADAAMYREKHA
jgi:diguanylate cyclase (GGDEF)-like protein